MRPKKGLLVLPLVLYLAANAAHASPVSRSSRMVREVYPEVEQDLPVPAAQESTGGSQAKDWNGGLLIPQTFEGLSNGLVCIVGDVVYGIGESVPSEQPCLKCTCSAPGVDCETMTCHQPPGCRAIHRPNKCCPDYQCECHHEGKTYANGERLLSAPGNECHVCYCRGGEVQCAEVGCYTRDDCEPNYVPGQCCPKYDHCPPREPISDRIQVTTEQPALLKTEQDVLTTWLMTGAPRTSTGGPVEEGSGDDSSPPPSTPVIYSIKEISKKKPEVETKLDKSTQTDDNPSRITIQEVIPQRTEYQITSLPKESTTLKTPVKIIEDSSNELTDSQSYPSEKTEVYDNPPPVLRIGEQLLVIKQGQLVPEKDTSTPSPVITIIGAEGLQIGVGSEEIIEHDLIPSNTEVPAKKPDEKDSSEETNRVELASGEPKTISWEETSPGLTTVNTLETVDVPVTTNPKKGAKPIKRDHGAKEVNDQPVELYFSSVRVEDGTEEPSEAPEVETKAPEVKTEALEVTTEAPKVAAPKKDALEVAPPKKEAPEVSPVKEDVPEVAPPKKEAPEVSPVKEDAPEVAPPKKEAAEVVLPKKNAPEVVPPKDEAPELVPSTKELPEMEAPKKRAPELADPQKDVEGTTAKPEKKEPSKKELKKEPTKKEKLKKEVVKPADLPRAEPLKSEKKSPHSSESESSEIEASKEATTDAPRAESSEEAPKNDSEDEASEEEPPKAMKLATKQEDPSKHPETTEISSEDSDSSSESVESTTYRSTEIEIQNDQPDSGSDSESESKEDVLDEKKHVELAKDSEEQSEEETTPKQKHVPLHDPEVSSSEESGSEEALKDDPKIIKDVLEQVSNHTKLNYSEKVEWLKEEKVVEKQGPQGVPLMNPKAALPDTLLAQAAASDFKDLEDSSSEEDEVEATSEKVMEHLESKKSIVAKDPVVKVMTELQKSKETLEESEESGSKETTTNKGEQFNLMAGDDASVEVNHSESSMDTSELVETIPGFERTTDKSKASHENPEPLPDPNHPKAEVEMVEMTTQSLKDEKHKRDVVKKVLKDTFDNPKENIRTELAEDAPEKVLEEIVKKSHEDSDSSEERTTEKFDPEVKIEDDFGDNPTKTRAPSETYQGDEPVKKKKLDVIQRVGSVSKLRETLDTSLIGIFRQFLAKNQLRYAQRDDDRV